jgi:CubicO group peptidase (beta-lactamase class C family)
MAEERIMLDRALHKGMNRRTALRAGALGAGAASLGAMTNATLAQDATPVTNPGEIPAPPGLPEITPEKVDAALARLDSLVQQTLDETNIPGIALAVVYQDEVRYAKGFGVREAGKDEPVTEETVFQLASCSKPLSSAVIAGVVSDGVVSWDSKLADLSPSFQMYTPWVTSEVTIRDMFSHRSGLPGHAGDLLEDLGATREEVLYRLRFAKPQYSFRAGYAYTNFGITAAGVAVADAAGTDWETLAEERLFRPLGMDHTSFRYAAFMAEPNHAVGHMKIDGTWQHKEQRQPDAEGPSGGGSSSILDMTRWMRLELNNGVFEGKEIMAAAPLAEPHAPVSISNPAANPNVDRTGFYGMGWNVSYRDDGAVQVSHSGAFNLGAATAVYLFPASGLGIMVLTNAQPIGAAETLCLEFADLASYGVIRADYRTILTNAFAALSAPTYGGTEGYLQPPAEVTPALPSNAYTGVYNDDYYGPITIAADGDAYTISIGPAQMTFPLEHVNADTFKFQPVGENAFGPSAVTFTRAGDGINAQSVTIDYLNQTGQGTFIREGYEPRPAD